MQLSVERLMLFFVAVVDFLQVRNLSLVPSISRFFHFLKICIYRRLKTCDETCKFTVRYDNIDYFHL